jgi:DNA polymerase-3 subunit epsilon
MKLDKPIVFFDIETTGMNQIKDRIIELHMTKQNPDGTIDEFHSRFNPFPVEITESASKVHGIYAEDLINEPTFESKVSEVLEFIEGSDLGGYNIINFDVPILFEECVRAGKMFDYRKHRIFDCYRMWTHFEPRTLIGATKRFLNRDLVDAHKSAADVEATVGIFAKQVEEWGITDFDELHKMTTDLDKKMDLSGKFGKNDSGEVILTFGKHANKTVQQIFVEDAEYFRWMYEKAEMPSDTKMIARRIYTKLSEKK